MSDKIETGSWNKFPHHSVQGTPVDFYVWINHGKDTSYDPGVSGASGWLRGTDAFENYAKLKNLQQKDKQEFIKLVEKLHKQFTFKGYGNDR